MDPEILLLDEPTVGLDAQSLYAVSALIRARALTTVTITHDERAAKRLGSEVLHMADGRIRSD